MNFLDALHSGRGFRRFRGPYFTRIQEVEYTGELYLVGDDYAAKRLSKSDILADDWEVEPKKKELSAEDIRKASDQVNWSRAPRLAFFSIDIERLIKELGLE